MQLVEQQQQLEQQLKQQQQDAHPSNLWSVDGCASLLRLVTTFSSCLAVRPVSWLNCIATWLEGMWVLAESFKKPSRSTHTTSSQVTMQLSKLTGLTARQLEKVVTDATRTHTHPHSTSWMGKCVS